MFLGELNHIPILEIVKGVDQPLGLEDPKLLNKLEATGQNIEGFDLHALQVKDQIIFALVKDETILTVLIGTFINFPSDNKMKTIQIGRTWTPTKFRNRGYSTALYDGLPRNGYRLISDVQVSPAALSIWKKLGTIRDLKFFDLETKQYTDKDPLTNEKVLFVLEWTGCHRRLDSIIKESIMFTATENLNELANI